MSNSQISPAAMKSIADDIRSKSDAELVELVHGAPGVGNAAPTTAPAKTGGRSRRVVAKSAKKAGAVQSRTTRGGVKAKGGVKASGRSAPRKAVARKAVARPSAPNGNPSTTTDNEAKVKTAIKAGHYSMGSIMQHSGLTKGQVTTAMNRLRDRKDVFMAGQKRLARYAFTQQEADRQHQIAKNAPAAPAPRRTRSQPVQSA
jgi:hypothetical protein